MKLCGKNYRRSSGLEDHLVSEGVKSRNETSENRGGAVWRGANALMAVFFLMATGVQFNDPDPFLWVPLYGIAAVLSASTVVRPTLSAHPCWRRVYWAHALYCVGMFFYALVQLVVAALHPESDGSLNPLTYEEGREMAGVVITVTWLFICKQAPTIRFSFPRWRASRKPDQENEVWAVSANPPLSNIERGD